MSRRPRDLDPDAATRADAPPPPRGHGLEDAPTVADGAAGSDRRIPERVGEYRIEQVLGEGGMGVVARAHDERLDRPVALKFLSGRLDAGDRELSRLQREGRLLQAVRHPHVLPLLAVSEAEGLPVLVLELVEGGSLDERLAAGPLPVEETLRLGVQVASALAEAHRLGIVHRDLKPANVLLDEGGNAKVSDFGLAARVADSGTPVSLASETVDLEAGGLVGTPAYMSPGQLAAGEPAPGDDVWALGCILHECLTGERAPAPGRAPAQPGGEAPAALAAFVASCFAGAEGPADGAALLAGLTRVHEELLGRAPELAPHEPAPAPAAGRRLPRPRSRFVGRRRELLGVSSLLGKRRLVTLTGAGGSGKTRLALEAALELESTEGRFPDGVTFAELATLERGGAVASRLAEALGVAEAGAASTLEAVVEALRAAHALLVLDNCEHLLEDAAAVVGRLLEDCPGVRVLATSREPLRLPNEGVLAIDPLPLPEESETDSSALLESDAAALFVDRARQARYGFVLDGDSAPLVARCCRRLDGIPLALELAAARLRTESLESLVEGLERSLGDLEAGASAALPRHRALRATIGWSVERLNAQERALYRRLAVFAGAFSLELAQAVGASEDLPRAEVLPLLIRLVERSLVMELTDEAIPAWRLLVPVREHATELLDASGERPARTQALIAGVRALADECKPLFEGSEANECVAELSVQHGTLVSALGACLETGELESGLAIFSGFGGYWHLRELWRDGLELANSLLSLPGEAPPELRGMVLLASAQLMIPLGEIPAAEKRLEEAIALLRGCEGEAGTLTLAEALNTLSLAANEKQELERSRELSLESLEIARAGGFKGQCISSLNQLGKVASMAGDQAAARGYLDEALALQREQPAPYALAALLTNLGVVALRLQDYDGARAYLEEAREHARACGTVRGELFVVVNLAAIASREGDGEQSLHLHRRGVELCRELSDLTAGLILMGRFANIALELGENERAARILGAGDGLRIAIGAAQFQDQAGIDAMLARAREALGDEVLEREMEAGRRLDLEGALDLADSVGR